MLTAGSPVRGLRADAHRRVTGARVQNHHGIVYPSLRQAGIRCGIGESIRRFNQRFARDPEFAAGSPVYDLLVIDEYQDITEAYAQLLRHIKSRNPAMQVAMVGDLSQKVRSDTTLDVQRFVTELCGPRARAVHPELPGGPELCEVLGATWNKPPTGVNTNQVVRYLRFDEAMDLLKAKTPGDLLCLGSRNGPIARALSA